MTEYEELVKKFGFVEGGVGTNEDGEYCIVTIDKESASIRTLQNNGWIRENTYYPDGTEEEGYTK